MQVTLRQKITHPEKPKLAEYTMEAPALPQHGDALYFVGLDAYFGVHSASYVVEQNVARAVVNLAFDNRGYTMDDGSYGALVQRRRDAGWRVTEWKPRGKQQKDASRKAHDDYN